MYDLIVLAVLLRKIRADLGMGTFDLVVNRLAYIMQQTRTLCKSYIGAQLGSHHSCKMSYFDGMLENILSVAGAVLQTADKLDQFMVQSVYSHLEYCLLACFAYLRVHLAAGLFYHFLYAPGVYPSIGYEPFQSYSGDLAANGIEA